MQSMMNHDLPAGRAIRIAAFSAVLASGALLAGCNIVTPIAYAIDGPGQIEAEYTLANKKTVVFVDDPNNIIPRTSLLTTVGDAVSFDLMQREILASTVSTRDAIAVARASAGADAKKLVSTESIARSLDASQVIHIQPVIFDITGRNDSQGMRPTATVRVKVIDMDTRERVYPSTGSSVDGRDVTATIRESDIGSLRSRAGRSQIEDELAKKVALEVAQLFYKHDRIDLGENLGTRRQ